MGIEDLLRERWLMAIAEMGVDGAIADAVDAFASRMGCSATDAYMIVQRGLRMLAVQEVVDHLRWMR